MFPAWQGHHPFVYHNNCRGQPSSAVAGMAPANVKTSDSVLAAKETKAIRWVRVILIAVVVCSTALTATIVFRRLRRIENEAFSQRFEELADTILDSSKQAMLDQMGDIDILAFDLESFARYSDSQWPEVTLHEFARRAKKFVKRTSLFYMGIHQLVDENERSSWENYTMNNNEWYDEVLEVQGLTNTAPVVQWNVIHDVTDRLEQNRENGTSKPGPYLPLWQNYPVSDFSYNFNAFESQRGAEFRQSLNSNTLLFSKPYVPGIDSLALNLTFDWFERLNPPGQIAREPVSAIYFPIVDEIENSRNVGVVVSFFYWRDLLSDTLPVGTNEVDIVLETCGEVFTYGVAGPVTVYKGSGDAHEMAFSDFEITAPLITPEESNFSRFITDHEYCNTNVYMFPTRDLQDAFITSTPSLFVATIILSSGLIFCLFLVYHVCVEKRQRLVLEKVNERTNELQDANEKLTKANEKILQSAAAQLQHFACMSHEIRTPLNCIIGCSSLMKEWKLSTSELDIIHMIDSSSSLLLAVVNDVLDYSRLETGNVDIVMADTFLQRAVDLVLSSMSRVAESEEKKILTFFGPNLPGTISTDIRRFQQILYNLMGNAVKFSRRGDTIELHLSVCNACEICDKNVYAPESSEPSKTSSTGRCLKILVKDYGKGIDPKHFERIFLAFSQDNEDKENIYSGSGLGLAITASLVHRMGGRIAVSSQPGQGSEFLVYFPLDAQDCTQSVEIDQALNQLKSCHIVLVSEQQLETDYLRSVLTEHKIGFTSSADLATTLKNRQSKEILLIIEDGVFDKSWAKIANEEKQDVRALLLLGCKSAQINQNNANFVSFTRLLPSTILIKLGSHLKENTGTAEIKSSTSKQLRVEENMETTEAESSKSQQTAETPCELDANVPYQSMTILMAEDNVVNQKVLKRLLMRLGAKSIDVVDNGQKAVEAEARQRYDIVLMDMQMPIMDGIDACKLIGERNELDTHPRAPVVFVTAHVLPEYEKKCYEAGGLDFIAKPCNLTSVDACFRRLLHEKKVGLADDNIARDAATN